MATAEVSSDRLSRQGPSGRRRYEAEEAALGVGHVDMDAAPARLVDDDGA
jgi:hypothetical protein